MDLHMEMALQEARTALLEIPAGAPVSYLRERDVIVADALAEIAEGEHPAEVLETMQERLETAATAASRVPVARPELRVIRAG